ncbi:MAG: class I SAM-dependent methyltransferase [Verrucomicrobiae bacterium]|nr:class I SAM-dependent methyltransferase [Verrucomicrobiae bacterium]
MGENSPYTKYFRRLRRAPTGYSDVVGGDFENMGYLQLCLLRHAGLKKDHSLVDVGCGTGRLAHHLNQWGLKDYRGYDVVKGMLRLAAKKVNQPHYFFGLIKEELIKIRHDTVDFVCFFSVVTHLPHHTSFRYLLDGMRVLKPGGRLVFSYLAYDCESHWPFFAYVVGNRNVEPTNQLMAHSQIRLWAERLGAPLIELHDGDKPFFPIDRPITLENGAEMRELGMLGQSVCILEKPEVWQPNQGYGS